MIAASGEIEPIYVTTQTPVATRAYYQLVAGFSSRVNLSGSLWMLGIPSAQIKKTLVLLSLTVGRSDNASISIPVRYPHAVNLRTVSGICLTPSAHWEPWPSAEALFTRGLQLCFETLVPRLPMERTADRKEQRWATGDSQHQNLWSFSTL